MRLITIRSSCTTRCAFCIKKDKKAKAKSFVVISSSPSSEKVKKIIVREICTKEISFV